MGTSWNCRISCSGDDCLRLAFAYAALSLSSGVSLIVEIHLMLQRAVPFRDMGFASSRLGSPQQSAQAQDPLQRLLCQSPRKAQKIP